MIRVLFLNTRSAIGADVAVHLTLIRNLDPARCEVTVATNKRAADHGRMLEILSSVPGVRTVSLNLGYEVAGRGKADRILGTLGNLAALSAGLIRLAWIVRRNRIDIIHSTDRPRDALLSTLLARITRRKNLIHMHIKWYPEIGRATKWALRKCGAVLAISEFVKRSLTEGGISESKIHVSYNATDPDEFDPANLPSPRIGRGVGGEGPLVGIIARIMVWKGHLELVEAMAKVREQIPDACLLIIGEEDRLASPDSYEARVKARIQELGIEDSVFFAGWIDDMPSAYADLDIVAVPSWEEPFGLAVTEGMAMETPVVGFDSGALPEIITNGVEGFLVPRGDIGAMAESIVKLLQDPDLRRDMGRSGRATLLKRFTPRRQADEVAKVYEHLARRPGDQIMISR